MSGLIEISMSMKNHFTIQARHHNIYKSYKLCNTNYSTSQAPSNSQKTHVVDRRLKVLSSEWGGTSECGGISYLVVPGTPWRCIKTSLPRGSWRWRIIWFQSLQSFRIQTREWIPSTPTDHSWRKLPPSCQQKDSRSMLENTDSSTCDCKFSFNKYM